MKKYLLVCLLLSSAAVAAEPVDFSQVLVGVTGEPMKQCAKNEGDRCVEFEPLTLSLLCVTALYSTIDEDRNSAAKLKFERDELARKIYKKSSVTLTAEEIATLKERVGKVYSAAQVGAAWRLLDPLGK